MNVPHLRSPYDTVGGLIYFGRLLDKIRLHAQGKLPADYQPNLGKGFDGRCCNFLHVNYDQLTARVQEGGTDDEILAWCFQTGRKPSDEEIEVWTEFMRKRGWNDVATARRDQVVGKMPPQWHGKIQTIFDMIEVDEGRTPRSV